MGKLVEKRLDHDDLLCRDAENEPDFRRLPRSEDDFDVWHDSRAMDEVDYFLMH
jgi:hypothetical protein